MRKVLFVAFLVGLMAIAGTANAYQFLLGTGTGLSFDMSKVVVSTGNFVFDNSSTSDWHLWDYGYYLVDGHQKFTTATTGWSLKISGDEYAVIDKYWNGLENVDNYPKVRWSIGDSWNTPIRGNGFTFSVDPDGNFDADLPSDGYFHWAGRYDDATMASEYYYSNFTVTGSLATGNYSVYAYAPDVPEPMSIFLGIMGLSSIAGYRRFRK